MTEQQHRTSFRSKHFKPPAGVTVIAGVAVIWSSLFIAYLLSQIGDATDHWTTAWSRGTGAYFMCIFVVTLISATALFFRNGGARYSLLLAILTFTVWSVFSEAHATFNYLLELSERQWGMRIWLRLLWQPFVYTLAFAVSVWCLFSRAAKAFFSESRRHA